MNVAQAAGETAALSSGDRKILSTESTETHGRGCVESRTGQQTSEPGLLANVGSHPKLKHVRIVR